MLDTRIAQTTLENTIRDAILYSLGKRLTPVSSIALLRSLVTQGATSSVMHDDHLIPIVVANVVTASYRWSTVSLATDDGVTVIKPNDVIGPGRWKRWTSPLRFSQVVGGTSAYLHELQSGPLERVIVLDKAMTEDEITGLIFGQVPSVVIEATEDVPEDATFETGHRWLSEYAFTVSVIAQNLRDRREVTQGSDVIGESPGANSIDGFIKAILAGTTLHEVVDGIRNVQIGRGFNWVSEFGQRRVIRSRAFNFQVTEENPNAPNDYAPAEEVDLQSELTDLNDQDPPFDIKNYVSGGITVSTTVGLTKPVTAGTALIDGVVVIYAGELFTFPAGVDTYRDLLPSGFMVFVSTATETAEPPLTPTAMRIGVTRTDGSGVVADRFIAATRVPYMNPFVHPLL